MRRFVSFFIAFTLIIFVSTPVMGQAGRYRLKTQVGPQGQTPTPSFRTGAGRTSEGIGVPVYPGMQPGMPGQQGMPGQADSTQMIMGYQVHVLGEVEQPGTYHIPPSGRLADAIIMASGLADNGSERMIELKRKGRKIQTVDLLNFRLKGSLGDNPYLLDNDVVFVPLRSNVVQVAGAIRRPEVYELRLENNLQQVVDLAGGFNAAVAKNEPIRIVRFKDGEKVVEEVSIAKVAMKRFVVASGDVIVIPNVVTKETKFDYNVAVIPGDQVFYPSYEDRVFVLGGVRQPGAYPFSPYYTVNQYISLAGGITQAGKERYKVITPSGEERKASESDRVNPGDTIKIKEKWMTPAGWLGFGLSIASFGLSASATILAITR